MQSLPSFLLEKTGIKTPLIGFYDAPAKKDFEPLIQPNKSGHACVFAFYKQWLLGKTLLITKDNHGCGGAGNHLCGVATRSRKEFIRFLTDDEGLKATHELMDQWLDFISPYHQQNSWVLIGPLKNDQYEYLKTITFFVTPDQLSMLMIGAQYFQSPDDPTPVIAPFGSGCMQLVSLFKNLEVPQAMIGATDMAMRKYLPSDILAFTVTKPMFEKLCQLDENSFLSKSFIEGLKKARKNDLLKKQEK
ncbi:MAG: DUF169 domain-containing protein [Bacteroidales bacterium]|nr:DUF169 domain-containing protein [Bacteroidales bacterium]